MSMQKAAGAALFLLPAFPATAQTSQLGLERLVRDQAAALEAQQARIDALERRLAALEPVVQETAVTAAEVAKARPVVETRLDRLERLRNLPAGNAAMRPASDPLTAPSPSQAANVDDESFDWTKGLPQITSADGKSAMRLRGRMLFDTSSSFGSNFDRRNITGTKASAIRLGVEGKLGDMIGYQVEFDLTDNQAALRGAYLSFTKKWGDNIYELSLGNRLTDRSMEGASSSDSQPFLERNATALATAPRKGSFGLGAMARVYGKTWHAAVQLDGNEASTNGSVSDSTTLTGRVHWNPWRNSEAIVHLGAWGYREDFSSGVASIPLSTRIGGRFNELITVQASSLLDPDHGQAFGLELGGVYKSFWMFGEYGERQCGRPACRRARRIDRHRCLSDRREAALCRARRRLVQAAGIAAHNRWRLGRGRNCRSLRPSLLFRPSGWRGLFHHAGAQLVSARLGSRDPELDPLAHRKPRGRLCRRRRRQHRGWPRRRFLLIA